MKYEYGLLRNEVLAKEDLLSKRSLEIDELRYNAKKYEAENRREKAELNEKSFEKESLMKELSGERERWSQVEKRWSQEEKALKLRIKDL